MALIRCPECGQEISDKAMVCIHCGNPLTEKPDSEQGKKKKGIILLITVLVLIILALTFLLFRDKEEKCSVSGCDKEVYSNGYCFDHYSQNKEERLETEAPQVTISEDEEEKPVEISKNKSVSTDGVCSFTVRSFTISQTISPPNPADYYTYFQAPNGSQLVDVEMDIKSLKSSPVSQNSLLDSVKILYDNEYEYYCGFVVETENGGDLDKYTSLHGINPLESMRYHMICEIPKTVLNQGKTMSVVISVAGKTYCCKLR